MVYYFLYIFIGNIYVCIADSYSVKKDGIQPLSMIEYLFTINTYPVHIGMVIFDGLENVKYWCEEPRSPVLKFIIVLGLIIFGIWVIT